MAIRTWYQVDAKGKSSPTTIDSETTVYTPPKTDIWRPSATEDVFDAPYVYTPIRSGSFHSISVSISGPWKTKFDQGGILIVWPAPSGKRNENKWMKTGIEYFEGKPALSVVGCDRFSDWSLSPMAAEGGTEATLLAEREGSTLWVYVLEGGQKRALREIKWAFMEGREADAEMWVGLCAAKPTPDEGDGESGIEVAFKKIDLQTRE